MTSEPWAIASCQPQASAAASTGARSWLAHTAEQVIEGPRTFGRGHPLLQVLDRFLERVHLQQCPTQECLAPRRPFCLAEFLGQGNSLRAIGQGLLIIATAAVDSAERGRIQGLVATVANAAVNGQGLLKPSHGVVPPPSADRYMAPLIEGELEVPEVTVVAVDCRQLGSDGIDGREVTDHRRGHLEAVHAESQGARVLQRAGQGQSTVAVLESLGELQPVGVYDGHATEDTHLAGFVIERCCNRQGGLKKGNRYAVVGRSSQEETKLVEGLHLVSS